MNTPIESPGLLTDLYQLTMAYGYWKSGRTRDEACFHLFFRKAPFQGGYAIACGLAAAVEYLEAFGFSEEDGAYLATLTGNNGEPLFEPAFIDYLQDLRFTGSAHAMEEGTVVFPHQPLLRIEGPLIQCQLVETALLNMINFSTLVATQSARIARAAQGEPVLEFGLRRAQGPDGGLSASRAAYIGGCAATSNVLAGKRFGIPVKGTHAHSWVMSFDSEAEAFSEYAKAMPNNCVFLVDTYDTIEGVKNAIAEGLRLREQGHEMVGIRLDSGDMNALSIAARQLLDEAGLPDATIVASNDLDEHRITELKRAGARINVWGVGTRLATAYHQPALGGVYKLGAIRNADGDWEDRIKLSEDPIKVSIPGRLQVLRLLDEQGRAVGDVMCGLEEAEPDQWVPLDGGPARDAAGLRVEALMRPVFENGKQVYDVPDAGAARERALRELETFPAGLLELKPETGYAVGLSKTLHEQRQRMIEEART